MTVVPPAAPEVLEAPEPLQEEPTTSPHETISRPQTPGMRRDASGRRLDFLLDLSDGVSDLDKDLSEYLNTDWPQTPSFDALDTAAMDFEPLMSPDQMWDMSL